MKDKKIIFVTGGVVSSIGKGLTAASLGALLEDRGLKVGIMKCDPYINIDPGTMSPLQHGEVYVTKDGAETDLDLGHYERFTSCVLTRGHSITTGQVYDSVIKRERRGDYLGGTVQVIPHITDEIKRRILSVIDDEDVLIVEIGGTIGDIEGLPFIEAIRQMRSDLGPENTIFMHVTYVPFIKVAGELKSKPTQHSVKALREVGIQPDILICRSEQPLPQDVRKKIGLFCSVHPKFVLGAEDSSSIYEVPLRLHREELDVKVCDKLGLKLGEASLSKWETFNSVLKNPKKSVKIALVGKYVDLKESYKSLHEALIHAGVSLESKVEIVYMDSESFEKNDKDQMLEKLKDVSGVLVPGGFGDRGVEGKIMAIQYARENKIPFFGICLGMQLATIEYARHVCGLENATSREFDTKSEKPKVIDLMQEQKAVTMKGGTMRLGSYACTVIEGSKAFDSYKGKEIFERHRHRYEFNNKYKETFIEKGAKFSGVNSELDLVEMFEVPDHPWFVGVQFHPEFKSKPTAPHPLFVNFVKSSLDVTN